LAPSPRQTLRKIFRKIFRQILRQILPKRKDQLRAGRNDLPLKGRRLKQRVNKSRFRVKLVLPNPPEADQPLNL
jgi:hypothetical protein